MMFNGQPLVRDLSGLGAGVSHLQIYCRDSGRKEATLQFNLIEWQEPAWPPAQPLRFLFEAVPGRAGAAARGR